MPTCQKSATLCMLVQISGEILARLYCDDSIKISLNLTWIVHVIIRVSFRRICMESSEYYVA